MAAWYYELNGSQLGPIDDDELKELFANNSIKPTTLVWQREFGRDWRPLSQTEIFAASPSANADIPPPLPSSAIPPPLRSAPQTAQQSAQNVPHEFLESDLTKQLIGTKPEYYLAKWATILQSAGYDAKITLQKRSWNWPAFLLPYGWMFYRKLYLVGGALFVLQLIYALSDELFSIGIQRALGVATLLSCVASGIYGNALYLDSIYKKWLQLKSVSDPAAAQRFVKRDGGTNIVAAVGAPILALMLVILSALMGGSLFGAAVNCSSQTTADTVQSIARKQIDKDGYMMFVVDSAATTTSLSAIRTQSSGGGVAKCAATINYKIAMKIKSGETEAVQKLLEQTLSKDITYTVERTDSGNDIYVTVYGLK